MGYLVLSKRTAKPAPVVAAAFLHGHTSAITCVDVSTELDIAVTGAADGMVLMHSVREAQYIRELRGRTVRIGHVSPCVPKRRGAHCCWLGTGIRRAVGIHLPLWRCRHLLPRGRWITGSGDDQRIGGRVQASI